uniref:ATP-grasp domain-containing protein n=1 Tax=viral metagenome TaxID=1070528 RepID=A0A6C0KA62_9ZZZZ
MKVAIVIGPRHNKWVETYNDTIGLHPVRRPWLEAVPPTLRVNEDGVFRRTGAFVRIDIAMAYALKFIADKQKNYSLDIVAASKVSTKLFTKYDFIFYHWVDLLIVPSIRKFALAGKPMAKLKNIYDKCEGKVFPPIGYADLIYDKCDYYSFLAAKGLPVGSTMCVTRAEFETSAARATTKVWKHIQEAAWPQAFAKPVWGTDAIDVGRPGDLATRAKVKAYLTKTFKNPRYPKVVFQKFYSDFEKTVPQIRTYWLGEKYHYSVVEDHTEHYLTTKDTPLIRKAKAIARKTLRTIRPLFEKMPPFLTRIDFGCCLEQGNSNTMFINEIEFNPGMYLYLDPVDTYRRMNFDWKMAEQADKIIRKFKSLNKI